MNTVPEKHILILSYYFPPMGGGGVQRITKTLKFWNYRRSRVSVVTVKPSFFYADDPGLSAEIPENLTVHHTHSLDPFRLIYLFRKRFGSGSSSEDSRQESSSLIRRLSNLIFIPDSRIFWLPFALWKLIRLQRQIKIDLVFATMPPFTTGLTAALNRMITGIPFVLDVRDAWTDNPYLPQMTRIHQYFQKKLEEFVFKKSSGIVFVNPALSDTYKMKHDFISQKPVITVRNGYDPDDFDIAVKTENSREKKQLKIGIIGTVYSQGNAPYPLLEAAKKVTLNNPEIRERLKIIFVGKWAGNFLQEARNYGIDHMLEFVDYLPHRKALQLAAQMDALSLAIQDDVPGGKAVTPGRIYEYLYLKKPVLAICHPESDLANLIRTCRAGEVYSFSDSEKIAETLEEWIRNPDKRLSGKEFRGIEEFQRQSMTRRLQDFLLEIIS